MSTALLLAIKDFPASPGPSWDESLDVRSLLRQFICPFAFQILFPGIVSTFVQEKTSKIRIMIKMMGLGIYISE